MISFDYYQIWKFEDLPDEEKESAIDGGCEPGKYYLGPPLGENEIASCPHCGKPNWDDLICEHLMFIADGANGGYHFELPMFVEFFWTYFAPKNHALLETLLIDIPEIRSDQMELPYAEGVIEAVTDLNTAETSHPYAGTSTTWAFGSDEFIKNMNDRKNSK